MGAGGWGCEDEETQCKKINIGIRQKVPFPIVNWKGCACSEHEAQKVTYFLTEDTIFLCSLANPAIKVINKGLNYLLEQDSMSFWAAASIQEY